MEVRKRGEEGKSAMRTVKNVLNLIFVLGAIVGLCIYFFSDRQTGTIVILVSMVFKMVEVILRMLRL